MREIPQHRLDQANVSLSPEDARKELDKRFFQHALGYQFTVGIGLTRVDSEFLHTEATVPAVELLRSQRFAGPLEEFHRAHEHYRQGRYKESMNAALNAVESTLKAICDRRKWKYSEGRLPPNWLS